MCAAGDPARRAAPTVNSLPGERFMIQSAPDDPAAGAATPAAFARELAGVTRGRLGRVNDPDLGALWQA